MSNLRGTVYSNTALEFFWDRTESSNSIVELYEIYRNDELVESVDAQSFFEEGLDSDTEYTYQVRAVDANGNAGEFESVVLATNP